MASFISAAGIFLLVFGLLECITILTNQTSRLFLVANVCVPLVAAAVVVWIQFGTFSQVSFSPSLLAGYALVSVGYISFSMFWHRCISPTHLFGHNTIPPEYQYLAAPSVTASVAKLAEIIFQNVLVFSLLTPALQSGMAPLMVSVWFTAVALLVHVPALWLYGRVFAGFFLGLIALLAPLFPFIILSSSSALALLFAIHVLMYPLRLMVLFVLGQTKTAPL